MRSTLLVIGLLAVAGSALSAEPRCAFLVREGTRETLVNRCDSCRQVKVQRDRPGDSFPTSRTVMLREGGQAPLPFRGSGATRILSELACEPTAGSTPLAPPACIKILPSTKVGPLLVNECDDCRLANIETRERDGRRLTRQFSLAGKASIPFTNRNALDARIISQAACKPGTTP